MLASWLKSEERDESPFSNFLLNDVREHTKPGNELKKYLENIYRDNIIDPGLYQEFVKRLGWERTKELFLDTRIPTLLNLKKGLFGEILNGSILEELFNYVIPIRKAQYAITQNQSLPSTDLVAIRTENGKINEVCFSESKLRIKYDGGVAVQGYKQLKKDQAYKMPSMLSFIMSRLYEQKNSLATPFLEYLCDRTEDSISIETMRLGIVNDSKSWKENTLTSLDEEIDGEPNPIVDLVLINDLEKLLRDFYQSIGVKYSDE